MSDDLKKLLETANSNVAKADALIAYLKQDVTATHIDPAANQERAIAYLAQLKATITDDLIPWKAGQGKVG